MRDSPIVNGGYIYTGVPAASMAGPVQSVPNDILESDANWKGVPVKTEFQHLTSGPDMLNCVTQATCSGIEMMAARKGIPIERISRRAIAILSGTTRYGNTNENVNRAILKYGLIPERLVAKDAPNWLEYYQADDIYPEAYDAGEETLRRLDLGFLFLGWLSPDTFRKHLQYSPLVIGIGSQDVATHEVLMTSPERDVIDSEIRSPGGASSFARLTPTRRIFSAMRVYIAEAGSLPNSNPVPALQITNRSLVTVVKEDGLDTAYYKDGKLIFGAEWMLQGRWIAENEANGYFNGGPVRTITLADAKQFPWVNLKGEVVPYPVP